MSMQERALYEFGRYRLIPAERLLLRDGEPVALTPKAFETLLVLLRRAGRLVEKDELLREVWPDTAVEESNVAQNVFALRKVLGSGGDPTEYIETVPKRGYRFLQPVTVVSDQEPIGPSAPAANTHVENVERTPVPATATSAPERPWMRGLPWLLAALVVLAGASLLLPWFRTPPSAEPKTLSMTRVLSADYISSAVISPDGRYIAHVVENGKRSSVIVRQLSTITDLVVVPPDGEAGYWGLAFSRDGDSLYFIKHTPGVAINTLYRVPTLGGTPRRVVNGVASLIAVSPDDARIAFVRERPGVESLLMIANADGSDERVLRARRVPKSSYSSGIRGGPSWSPDGTTIATGVISIEGGYHGEVHTVTVRDGKERQLTSHRWHQVAQTAWLPDGKSVLVTAREKYPAQLFEVRVPEGTVRPVLTDLTDYHGVSLTADGRTLATIQHDLRSTISFVPPKPAVAAKRSTEAMHEGFYGMSFTPTGELVYASDAAGNHDVWMTAIDGVSTRQLTNDPEHDSTPSVSPDGRSIVFISRRGGNAHVWLMDIDGRNARQLTNHASEGTPSFTPDGRWVVYAASSEGIWKIPARGGKPIQLFAGNAHTPSVSPDGSRVACFYRAPGPDATNRIALLSMTPAAEPLQIIDFPEGFSGATVRWTQDSRALIHAAVRDDVSNLWTLPLDGSAPEQLTHFTADYIFNYDFSRDRKELAVARGSVAEHVVVVRDFR